MFKKIAIAKFFDGEQPDPVAEALAAQNAAPTRSTRQENLQESLLRGSSASSTSLGLHNRLDAAPRIVPQPEDQIVQRTPFLFTLLFSPFNLIYKILSSSLSLFTYLFPFLPRLLQRRSASRNNRMGNTPGRRQLNPRDTAARFKREFEEEYGPSSLPFFEGGYAQARDLAQKDLRFLLVVLMSPEHDYTSTFVQDTLLSPEVTTFLNDPANNIILWAGNVQDSEAYQVSTGLRCTKFPFSALITHTPREGATAMSTVARLAGYMPATTYVAKLQSAIATYSEQLAAVRTARSVQQFERSLRVEQDSAYERSLAQDRERARQRREAEAAATEAEKKAAEAATAAESLASNLDQWKRWRAALIDPEPGPEVKDTVRIGLRMPESAERVTRKFRADANIEELYAFVECYDIIKDGSVSETVNEPLHFKHTYGFRLVTPMPRTVYDLEDGGTIGDRVGKSGNLIVEPILDDHDE
jgi:FAS-associated factor 2